MSAHRTTQLDLTPAQRRCVDALDAHQGNRTAAADALGMDQRSFRRRLAEAVERGADLPEPADTAPVRKPRRIEVKLDDLVLSRDLQPRVGLDESTVADYAALYRDRGPAAMDPVRAFTRDDGRPILTRGFTRVAAARLAGLDALPCDLYAEADDEVMLRDSLSGNRHGLRLTNADKRRALKLYHERIPKRRWDSTREVAALLGCSHELVAAFRKELTAPKPAADVTPATLPATPPAPADSAPPTAEDPASDGPEEIDLDSAQDDDQPPSAESATIRIPPQQTTPTPPITFTRSLADRRLERMRELVCQRILEHPGTIAPGCHRELALLLLIVGLDSDPEAEWNDAALADADSRWDAAIAARVTTEIRAGNPHLPVLDVLCRLWQLDPDAIRIQAERAVPA